MKLFASCLGWCRLLQKYVCVYEQVRVCTHKVHMCVTHLVLAFGVCVCLCSQKSLFWAPGQVTKLSCFPSSLVNFSFLNHQRILVNVALLYSTISFLVTASSKRNWCCDVGKLKKLRRNRDWQHSHKRGMNVLKLCTGSRPVWICRHEGSRINIFKHFFPPLDDVWHKACKYWTKLSSNVSWQKIHLLMYNDPETSVFKCNIARKGLYLQIDWKCKRLATCSM